MKKFLFIILVAVAAVLLWAIRTEAYSNGLVFSLGLVVTALSGYLIADYFFRLEKSSLKDNLHVSQKENQALKERNDLLQTQLTTATPHAEVEQFEQRLAILEDEKNKLDGMSRAQTAEIANLKEKLEAQQKNNSKLFEEATVSSGTAQTQLAALQSQINSAKTEISVLNDKNAALQKQNDSLAAEVSAKNIELAQQKEALAVAATSQTVETDFDTEGVAERSLTGEMETVVSGRDLVVTELEETETVEGVENFGTSDNLQAIEGIGPKIDAVLKAAGITNWEKLSMATPEHLRVVLDNAGKQYQTIDPTSWTEQARLLVHGEFAKLKKYTESI